MSLPHVLCVIFNKKLNLHNQFPNYSSSLLHFPHSSAIIIKHNIMAEYQILIRTKILKILVLSCQKSHIEHEVNSNFKLKLVGFILPDIFTKIINSHGNYLNRAQKKNLSVDNYLFNLVHFSHSVVSNSLWPHGLQHARPPCPSPTPRVYPNPCP